MTGRPLCLFSVEFSKGEIHPRVHRIRNAYVRLGFCVIGASCAPETLEPIIRKYNFFHPFSYGGSFENSKLDILPEYKAKIPSIPFDAEYSNHQQDFT